jgi:hypothetical protein
MNYSQRDSKGRFVKRSARKVKREEAVEILIDLPKIGYKQNPVYRQRNSSKSESIWNAIRTLRF